LTAVLALSFLTASAIIWLSVGRALRPLAEFAPAFLRLGSGDYEARVREEGPLELVRLGRGVNVMTERLGSMQARNHALESQLTTLQEEERADLARDLHDEIGPHLFAVNVDAAMVRRLIEEGKSDAAIGQVKAIEGSVAHMQTLVREILSRLRPTEVSELGLVDAIAELVAFWRSRRPAIHFDLCLAPDETLPRALREPIYRIVQEGLTNAVRHGKPHKITIEVAAPVDDLVIVKVADDGAHAKPTTLVGFGLVGMRERVAAVRGHLTIDRGPPGKGWMIVARLPIAPEPAGPGL
jgi:two-component system sensor histidine kinase UhpB